MDVNGTAYRALLFRMKLMQLFSVRSEMQKINVPARLHYLLKSLYK